MTNRTKLLAIAAVAAMVSTAASAQGFSFLSGQPNADQSQVRQPGHNRYAPFVRASDTPAGSLGSSGFYTSRARAADGAHNRYTD